MKSIALLFTITVFCHSVFVGNARETNPIIPQSLGKSYWILPNIMYEYNVQPSLMADIQRQKVIIMMSGYSKSFSLDEPHTGYLTGSVSSPFDKSNKRREMYLADVRIVVPVSATTVAGVRVRGGADVDGYTKFVPDLPISGGIPSPETNNYQINYREYKVRESKPHLYNEIFIAERISPAFSVGASLRLSQTLFRDVTTSVYQLADRWIPAHVDAFNVGISTGFTLQSGNMSISAGALYDRFDQTVTLRNFGTSSWWWFMPTLPVDGSESMSRMANTGYIPNIVQEVHSIARAHFMIRHELTDRIDFSLRVMLRGQWSDFGDRDPEALSREHIQVLRPYEDIRTGFSVSGNTFTLVTGIRYIDFRFQKYHRRTFPPYQKFYIEQDHHWKGMGIFGGYRHTFLNGMLSAGIGFMYDIMDLTRYESDTSVRVTQSVIPTFGLSFRFNEKIAITVDASDNFAFDMGNRVGALSQYSLTTGIDIAW